MCSCGETVYSQMSLEVHQQDHHHNGHDQEFEWVLLQIGLGHVEMNFARSFLELNRDVSTNLFVSMRLLVLRGERSAFFAQGHTCLTFIVGEAYKQSKMLKCLQKITHFKGYNYFFQTKTI